MTSAQRSSIRTVSLLLLPMQLLLATSCSSWRMQERPPASSVEGAERPRRVRLLLVDGRTLTLNRAHAVGDSLIGYWGVSEVSRTAVPVAQIREMRVREPDGFKTGVLVVCLVGIVLAVYYAAAAGIGAGVAEGIKTAANQ